MTEPVWNTEELRTLVREALAELLPNELVKGDSPVSGVAPTQEKTSSLISEVRNDAVATSPETITIRNDTELGDFVLRLLHVFENPKHREDLRTGRLRFHLASAPHTGASTPVRRIEQGAVTEAMVRDAARAGAQLVLGKNAVMTPLARDRARSDGVVVERERK
ncbi:hypothetical protein [Ferrimicrobium sp.]|uniref:hypothetical protein n=1 Tax=Ferrimicrobium sp. TaxID=2926050 RepID=UPI0027E47BAF|nr:hypothetical protein [Ferrimicrobium sp.]